MLWNLIQTDKGKDIIMMTDSLSKINNRKKALSQSGKKGGRRVTYRVEKADENQEKFYKKPHDRVW